MKRVGFVGWRGMVGSVLMARMHAEKDFDVIDPSFFSASNPGSLGPFSLVGKNVPPLKDAYDLALLAEQDIIVTCQGSAYTTHVQPKLRAMGWGGYWIDAAKTLRMQNDAMIVLDPVNLSEIERAIDAGIRHYIGSNCTVSCLLMALHGLFQAKLIDWVTTATYQAASGGGAAHMRELLTQFGLLHAEVADFLADPAASILEIERSIHAKQTNGTLPMTAFGGVPLAGNLLPWIDEDTGAGLSLEEAKATPEVNKILGKATAPHTIPIESLCIRIGALRCHSQALTIKLKKNIPLADIHTLIAEANPWVQLIPNEKEASLNHLTPAAAAGTLQIPIGRLRKLAMGPEYLAAFTVGDQLLWGAAEPLRRMLAILLARL